ncbi:14529_t:CDS:2 [Funneliformis geosporum]|uniref:14529_t:CDS:1 n=1 Tax=Funneliformis geosporum TaxID=1117311 RepID=A0A9W4SK59_9GLOM|nr:14529_t:CDS:2 [Funneliformis geosporum]
MRHVNNLKKVQENTRKKRFDDLIIYRKEKKLYSRLSDTFYKRVLHLNENNLSLPLVSDNPQLSIPRVLIETDDIASDSMVSNKETSGYSAKKHRTLREITQKQLRLKETIENRFNNVIDTITSLKEQQSALSEIDQKEKKIEPFFKGSVKQLSYKLFHNHKTVSDEEIKEMLKGF